MSLLLLMTTTFLFDGPFYLKPGLKLASLPEDSAFFLESPMSFDVDPEGNYYVADAEAKVIFTWDKNGRYLKTIGKPGEGPGEFSFTGRGGGQAFVSFSQNNLYVYDGRRREVLLFDASGNYLRSTQAGASRSRASNFGVTDSGQMVLQSRRFSDEGPQSSVVLLDKHGKISKTFVDIKDRTFEIKGGQAGSRRSFTLRAFYPALVSQLDSAAQTLIIGNSGEASFKVYDLAGGSERTIKVPLSREEVTKADKEEFERRFEQSDRRPSIEYPDQKAFYTNVLSLGNKGFLVYNLSPYYGKVTGVHLDQKGTLQNRFQVECGQGGALLGARGRILSVGLNEDDDFVIQEVTAP